MQHVPCQQLYPIVLIRLSGIIEPGSSEKESR
jgi:hypothetical protein